MIELYYVFNRGDGGQMRLILEPAYMRGYIGQNMSCNNDIWHGSFLYKPLLRNGDSLDI